MHTTLDLAVQDVAEKVVRDGGMEYDNERILLAEKAIERCVEALGILVQARQHKMEQASLLAATRSGFKFKPSTLVCSSSFGAPELLLEFLTSYT